MGVLSLPGIQVSKGLILEETLPRGSSPTLARKSTLLQLAIGYRAAVQVSQALEKSQAPTWPHGGGSSHQESLSEVDLNR